MLPRLAALRAELPWLELKLRVDENISQLRPDEYDLGIYHRPVRMADFVMQPLGPERMVPVCAPGQPPLVEMEAPLLLTMEETFKEWTDWGNWLFSADVALPPDTLRWKMGSYRLAIEAAMQGIGVAMGWTWLVQDLIDAGRLVEAHPHRRARAAGAGRLTARHGGMTEIHLPAGAVSLGSSEQRSDPGQGQHQGDAAKACGAR